MMMGALLLFAHMAFAYRISLGCYEGVAGGTVRVPVALDTMTNIAGMHLQINYDPSLLAVQNITPDEGVIQAGFVAGCTNDTGKINAVFAGDTSVAHFSGSLMTITFRINSGAVPGMYSDLVVARSDLAGDGGVDLTARGSIAQEQGRLWVTMSADCDSDGDGLSDYEEQMINGLADYDPGRGDTDARNPDTDGDGMPDGYEVRHHLNPLKDDSNLDPDGDGQNNLQEWIANTDPADGADYFKVADAVAHPDRDLVLYWQSATGRWYDVCSATNLALPVWRTNLYHYSGDGGRQSYTSTNTAMVQFFHIRVQMQDQ